MKPKDMPVKNIRAYVGDTVNANRSSGDFYSTPEQCTVDLLGRETFDGPIWECACGEGAISEVLKKHNYKVYSSDIEDRGYGVSGIDFLTQTKPIANILTNPPFKYSTEFCIHALKLAEKKAVFFNKLSFLEGVKRRAIFEQGHLKNIYVYSRRVNLKKNQKEQGAYISMLRRYVWRNIK
jgi:hypothetical protein